MHSFKLLFIFATQVLFISCQGGSWTPNHQPDSTDSRDPDDEFVMVIEYDNCPTHEYVSRKATVTKLPLSELHHSHRRSSDSGSSNVNTNVNTNTFRRAMDENTNTNVNTNSFRRSLDDNSNVNTNVNSNSARRSLDNGSVNTNTNVNSNGGDAAISVQDGGVNIEARRSHAAHARRNYGHSHGYGHRRNAGSQARRNVVVSNKGSEVAVLDSEGEGNGVDVIVDHNADAGYV